MLEGLGLKLTVERPLGGWIEAQFNKPWVQAGLHGGLAPLIRKLQRRWGWKTKSQPSVRFKKKEEEESQEQGAECLHSFYFFYLFKYSRKHFDGGSVLRNAVASGAVF